mmetsp:Transcript_53097/g.126336  ORF Transcript_53097/g.126336 Transcript_53097/m.126336 type:complete len:209 (-) Transcript_53097:36-662(-)
MSPTQGAGVPRRKAMITNPEQLRKNVRRAMLKLNETKDKAPAVIEQRQIDFAWCMVDWRTFDPASPLLVFQADPGSKEPSALEQLVITLKNSSSSQVHYACCAAIAYLSVRQDVRAALVETGSGPLMESLDLMVRRLEATENAGLRYAICAIATELCKGEAGLMRLRDINFAQALERLRQKKKEPRDKDAALEMIIDHLCNELRPKMS